MSSFMGVDPGLTGAVALVDDAGSLLWVVDMPVADKRVMGSRLPRRIGVELVAIEWSHSMPGQGVASTFKFGAAWGAVHGAYSALGYRIVDVRPTEWKKFHRISGDKKLQKERALRLAQERWPEQADLFSRRKDAGRAEAALIAVWAADQGNQP